MLTILWRHKPLTVVTKTPVRLMSNLPLVFIKLVSEMLVFWNFVKEDITSHVRLNYLCSQISGTSITRHNLFH